jgi:quinol monooxygenase YgiN
MKIAQGKAEEFKRIYRESIIPALSEVKGCNYVYLTQRPGETNEATSVTVWSSREDAEAYEQGGLYEKLVELLRPTLSGLYQWKMDREKRVKGGVAREMLPSNMTFAARAFVILIDPFICVSRESFDIRLLYLQVLKSDRRRGHSSCKNQTHSTLKRSGRANMVAGGWFDRNGKSPAGTAALELHMGRKRNQDRCGGGLRSLH